jgi:hypothetical protein
MSKNMAVARARTDIAFQLNASVKAMIIDYAQESGSEGNTQALNFVETISKQIAEIDLQGAKTVKRYVAKDGTWYAMVSYPLNALTDEVGKLFERNEAAAFSEFKAQEALKRLDSELQNNPPKSSSGEGSM